MKNFIKIITIFGMTASVSPVYSMKSEQASYYVTSLSGIRKIDSCNFPSLVHNKFFPPTHSLSIQEGTVFQLAIIRFLEGSETKIQYEENLKTIYDAVSKGVSETSMNIMKPNTHLGIEEIQLLRSRTPISSIELTESWFKARQLEFEPRQSVNKDKKNDLIATIFKGKFNRKKELSCTLTLYTHDKLKTEIPPDIIDLILLYLSECNVDEGKQYSSKLIEQAKQEFD